MGVACAGQEGKSPVTYASLACEWSLAGGVAIRVPLNPPGYVLISTMVLLTLSTAISSSPCGPPILREGRAEPTFPILQMRRRRPSEKKGLAQGIMWMVSARPKTRPGLLVPAHHVTCTPVAQFHFSPSSFPLQSFVTIFLATLLHGR